MENTNDISVDNEQGCLTTLVKWGIRQVLLLALGVIMVVLTFANLYASSTFGEVCGEIHPFLFEVGVDIIDASTHEALSFPNAGIDYSPFESVNDSFFDSIPEQMKPYVWDSCLQYYGYHGEKGFQLNYSGIDSFGQARLYGYDYDNNTGFTYEMRVQRASSTNAGDPPYELTMTTSDDNGQTDTSTQMIDATAEVVLSEFGTYTLYLILPGLVILIPIFTIMILHKSVGVHWWIVMTLLVGGQTLTASLLYIHLARVSGISTLEEFGIGIFGGIATGTALAFMGKVLDRFG